MFLNINDFIHTAICCQVTFITGSLLGTAHARTHAQTHGIRTLVTATTKSADLRTVTQYSSIGVTILCDPPVRSTTPKNRVGWRHCQHKRPQQMSNKIDTSRSGGNRWILQLSQGTASALISVLGGKTSPKSNGWPTYRRDSKMFASVHRSDVYRLVWYG